MSANNSQEKTKIMYLITKGNFGGAQKYVYELATSLPKETFDVGVAFGTEGGLNKRLTKANIPTHHIGHLGRDISILDEFRVLFDLIKLFREERPDIIHVNSSKIGGLGSFAGRIAGVPKIIFTAHGWAFKENRPFLARSVIWLLSYITVLFSHHTIVVSKDDEDRTRHFIGLRNKISQIHIGIQPFTLMDRKEARKRIQDHTPLPTNFWKGTILTTIAELTTNKGLIYALNAIKALPEEYKYLIIGDGEDEYKIRAFLKQHNLESRVVLTGRMADARTLLSAADMFIFPSIKEGLPYTLVEAGFAKIPVIATRTGGIPEVIMHERTGILVAPKNPKSLVHAIETLTPEEKERYTKALYVHTTNHFTFAHMLTETLAVYES